MKIYFVHGDKTILLPINPAKLKAGESSKNRVASVINVGDINIPDVRALTEISFDAFFPVAWTHACSCGPTALWKPISYVKALMAIKNSKKPVRVVMVGNMQDILKGNNNSSCLFLLEDMQYEVKAGEEADIYYSIKLRQYRNFEPRMVTFGRDSQPSFTNPSRPTPPPPVTVRKHTVAGDESLWLIARKYYGDGDAWGKIAKQNNLNTPSLIYPGQVLVIP